MSVSLPVAQLVRDAESNPRAGSSPTPISYANCSTCPLLPVRNPILGHGNPHADLALVGEGPGRQEVKAGRPFVGPSGKLLDQTLLAAGIDRKDVYATNTVACRSTDQFGDDAPPPAQAVSCCRPRLLAELSLVKPKLILTLGASAAKGVLQTKAPISEIQGVVEHRGDLPAPVLPTYHPAAVLHGGAEDIFEDLLSATKRAVRIAKGELVVPPRDEVIPVKHVVDKYNAAALINDILNGAAGYELAIDVETDGLDIISAPLLQVAIGNREKAAVIESAALVKEPSLSPFRRLLSDSRFTFLIHNSSFDLQWLQEHFGVVPPNVVDTMALALGTTEHGKKVGLKALSREWLNAPHFEAEVHSYLGVGKTGWANVPRDVLARYAGRDVVYTARVAPLLTNLCREENTLDLVRTLLEPAQRTFAEVERHGVLIDRTYLATLEYEWAPKLEQAVVAIQDYAKAQGFKQYETQKARIEKTWIEQQPRWEYRAKNGKVKITKTEPKRYQNSRLFYEPVERRRSEWADKYVEAPLNPRSVPQLRRFIYDHLKLRPIGGELSTGKPFRDTYPRHALTELLEAFSLIDKMLNTYVRGLADDIRADSRVHPSIMLAAARTGRLSMHNPPLQTIPKERTVAEGFNSIKRMFLPSPGHVWLSADFSQLEVRVAWFLSEDDVLGEAVMSGDFHKAMAAKIFNTPYDKVTDQQRDQAKTTNFGIFYGITAAGLSERLGISQESAQVLIDGVFDSAPKYHEWYKAQHRTALTEGRITTPFGRVRRWSLITRENKQNILNQACNFPVQSTATDLNLNAFINLHREFKQRNLGHLLFPVHDSIEAEVREGREAEAVELVNRVMTTWPFLNPADAVLETEVKIGKNWGDTKVWRS